MAPNKRKKEEKKGRFYPYEGINYYGKREFRGQVDSGDENRVFCIACQEKNPNHKGIRNQHRDIASHISCQHTDGSAYDKGQKKGLAWRCSCTYSGDNWHSLERHFRDRHDFTGNTGAIRNQGYFICDAPNNSGIGHRSLLPPAQHPLPQQPHPQPQQPQHPPQNYQLYIPHVQPQHLPQNGLPDGFQVHMHGSPQPENYQQWSISCQPQPQDPLLAFIDPDIMKDKNDGTLNDEEEENDNGCPHIHDPPSGIPFWHGHNHDGSGPSGAAGGQAVNS